MKTQSAQNAPNGKSAYFAISKDIYKQWQDIVDLIARMVDVPACLIMRADTNDIEVFVSSQTQGNPYRRGAKEPLYGSGLYCEYVISRNEQLMVTNAIKSPDWCTNPDLALDMICYLGFPIRLNSGDIFGTLCILDRQERNYTSETLELMEKMRSLIEAHLQMNERFLLTQQLQGDATLRQILDHLPVPVLCGGLGPELLTRYVNRRFIHLFGYTHAEIATQRDWVERAYPDPDYRAAALGRWNDTIRQADEQSGFLTPGEYLISCKDGTVRNVIVHGQLFADMILISFIDITAERQAVTQLHTSERRHRLLADHAADLIWTLDLDSGVTSYISPSVFKILGYTQDEYTRQPMSALFIPDSWLRLSQVLEQAKQKKNAGVPISIHLIEVERICKDGSTIWLELSGSGIYDDHGNFVELVCICRDISERKRHEYEIIRAKLAAESSSKATSEILRGIAHQWRQPLSTVDMVVQSISKAFANYRLDNEFITKAVTDARRQITFMSETINTFRSFFHTDKERVLFDTGQIIRDVIALLEQPFSLNAIVLAVSLQESPRVQGNPNELKQVLMNILINAQEAIVARRLAGQPEQGCITICQQRVDRHLQIMISDNGGGIAPVIASRIFEPNFTTKEQRGGSGIGLYLCKMIIEQNMQGSLTATNSTDGAVFTICLQGAEHV